MLLGFDRAQMRRVFRIDLVPRAADQTLEIAPQRRQVLVELLPAAGDAVRPPHALIPGQVLKRPGASFTMSTTLTWALNDHARHVSPHGSAPVKREPRSRPVPAAHGRRR